MSDLVASARAVSLGPPKEAALYFERVFPFDMSDTMLKKLGIVKGDIDPNAVPIPKDTWDIDVLASLLGSRELSAYYVDISLLAFSYFIARSSDGKAELLDSIDEAQRDEFDQMLVERCGFRLEDLLKPNSKKKLAYDPDPIHAAIVKKMREAGFASAPTWKTGWADKKNNPVVPSSGNRYVATLSGLDLIDVNAVPWDAVVELRRDPQAMAELRAFRLFFTENFKEGEPNYLVDKILHLHERHKATARLWGMKTAQRSFSVLLDKPTMASSTLVGAGLGIIGGPVAAVGALAIPIGKAALEVMKARIDMKESLLDRPLQYLTRLESLPREEEASQ